MTDTQQAKLLAGLDQAEAAHTAAFALARQLLAAPDPSRPIRDIQVVHVWPDTPALLISAYDDRRNQAVSEATSQAWADILGSTVVVDDPSPDFNRRTLHFNADGVLDGIRVHVWSAADVPITDPVITKVRSRYRITYQQRGEQRQLMVASEDEALRWVQENADSTATAETVAVIASGAGA